MRGIHYRSNSRLRPKYQDNMKVLYLNTKYMSQISQSWVVIMNQIFCYIKYSGPQGPDVRIAKFTSLTFLLILFFDLSVEGFVLSIPYNIYLYGPMNIIYSSKLTTYH